MIPDTIKERIRDLETSEAPAHQKHQSLRMTTFYQKQFRPDFLARHPFCRMCEEKGAKTFATEVDHVVPAYDRDLDQFFDEDNLQSLCFDCHVEKSGQEFIARMRTRYMPEPGIYIDADGIPHRYET